MARIGISITKNTTFRNSVQEFSNVYYYELFGGLPDSTQANAWIDALVAYEKTFHGTPVNFVRGRLWSQTGDKATSEMISQKNLSGAGSTATSSNMDKERAFLFRLRAGSDSRGNPVYFRKWFHSAGNFGATGPGATVLANTTGWSAGERTSMENTMNKIGDVPIDGNAGKLVSKNGRTATAGATWTAHPYLEHHQLGDQWRAQ